MTQSWQPCVALASLLFVFLSVLVSSEYHDDGKCLSNPTIKLHNGVEMPLLLLGAAHLVEPSKPDLDAPKGFVGMLPELTYRQIELALQAGMRAFDTAYIYRSQKPIGHVLGEWWRTGQLEARKDIWLTSKVFHPDATHATFRISHMPDMPKMSPEEVSQETQRHFEEALLELNVGYIDLMLLHWPAEKGKGTPKLNRQQRLAAWKVLEDMYHKGWCRAIGVSNFSVQHLEQLKEDGASIVPMVNQIEASVEVQRVDIREYCKKNGIVPQAYSALRGLSDMPDSVVELAAKYKKDPGQIVFRYLIQHGYSVIYLTSSEQRMVSNANVFDFDLSADEMKILDLLNREDGGWGLPRPDEID